MPLPMVVATWVEISAPTKLRPAAIMIALRTESARVEMQVAMAFAVSWNPLMKSNNRAATITIPRRSSGASGILQRHAFQDVRRVLAPVGGGLEGLVDLLPLEDRHRVLLVLEQERDGVPADPVCLVLEGAHLDAMLVDAVPLPRGEVGDPLVELLDALEDEEPELLGVGSGLRDLEEEHPGGRGLDQVDHVVQRRGQRQDILPVDRCDEGRVQLPDDVVGQGVPLVLHLLDRPDPLPEVVELLEHLLEALGPLHDVLRRLPEE